MLGTVISFDSWDIEAQGGYMISPDPRAGVREGNSAQC